MQSMMSSLRQALAEESITRGLGDMEARLLVEWLVDRAETVTQTDTDDAASRAKIGRLLKRVTAIARFVHLWTFPHTRRGAVQLAGAERFAFPLPNRDEDPWELMHRILQWESLQPS